MMVLSMNIAGWAQDAPVPFAGTFANGQITLVLQGGADGYSGQVQVGAERFPLQAQALSAVQLQGTYTYHGQPMPFQARLQGTTLTITDSDGSIYALQRQAPLPGNTTTAAEPRPARETSPGELHDPGWGIRFTVPEGWTGHRVDGGFLLGSNTLRGFILVTPLDATTLDDVRAEAQQGLTDDAGTHLMLSTSLESFTENGLAGNFSGTVGGHPAKARIVGVLSPHGAGATVMGAAEEASYTSQHVQAVEAVAHSIRFSVPEGTPLAAQWHTRFAGMRLTYMESYYSNGGGGYGGYSDKKVFELCPDGTFVGQENFNLSIDTGGASGSARNNPGPMRGRWQVKDQGGQALLEMTYPNGSVTRFRLEHQDGTTHLDGQRWYVTNDATACF